MAPAVPASAEQNLVLSLLRAEDLLALDFEFINLELRTDKKGARLFRIAPAPTQAYIVVHFQPQSIAEEAFFETATNLPLKHDHPDSKNEDPDTGKGDDPLRAPPIQARMAGPSRLAFVVPDTVDGIPCTVASLLDWARYELSVVPAALPPNPTSAELTPLPQIAPPQPHQTAIELPYRLIVSPNRTAGWVHASGAVRHAGRTELWHTRMGVRVAPPPAKPKEPLPAPTVDEEGQVELRTLRAIWSPDYTTGDPPPINNLDPFRSSLTRNDRYQIVRLTSDFGMPLHQEPPAFYNPLPIAVERLMLTSQGAWLRSRGAWNTEAIPQFDLEEWRHIATLARDHYVRVVYRGFLYPFGHRASLIKVTERKIQPIPDGDLKNQPAAYLRQRMFIVVREPEKQYLDSPYQFEGREMPLAPRVRLTTLITPDIDKPDVAPSAIDNGVFWVQVGGAPFPFHVTATDIEGQTNEFTAAMIFIRGSVIDAGAAKARAEYNLPKNEGRRKASVPGQPVAYAKRVPDKPGETSLTTDALYFDTDPLAAAVGQLNFLPKLAKADVRVPAVEQLIGGAKPLTIELYDQYLAHGLTGPENQADLFAKLISADNKLPFPAQKAGGLATPSLDLSGLSQSLGPVAGTLEDLRTGTFNPADFFKLADAKLLGCISLADLISAVFHPNQFPKLLTDTVRSATGVPEQITTTLDWKPEVHSTGPFEVSDDPGARTTLEIVATITKKLDLSQPTFKITGDLTNFAVNFLDVIRVNFKSLAFVSEQGRKLDVSANLTDKATDGKESIEFLGALAFINELRQFIPADGFKDPPSLDVGPSGVDVGYSLALPPLAVGVFSLQNVSLGAGLHLPFDGGLAALRFNFAERHSPFLLTVSLFGGGGFVALGVAIDRVIQVEAALEFGGNVAIDLGVASGGVHVMAGIYFKLAQNVTQLSGYVRCGGSLSVLGLITVSVEFYLELSYINGKARGRATLTVEIEVLFFSKSVELTVEKSFGGSSGDPTFGDVMQLDDWKAYGNAFA